ncbi:MAG TPA: hypothetical protein VH120_21275 [Gemmataceae bacterium]|jgi:hypothetical protein|nr:hypothetical protein [Gemmataceae bacterium]
MSSEDSVDSRQKVGGTDRLGLKVIHTGCEAALLILFPAARRHGNDGQVSPSGQLPLPNRSNDLKTVQLRHVIVQEQQVKTQPPGRVRGRGAASPTTTSSAG